MESHSDDGVRLNKFIAAQLNVGRRAADDLITSGRVHINGQQPNLGARVRSGDEVRVNGTRLLAGDRSDFIYIAFHKPIGYICSRRQQGDTPTIYALLPAQYQHLKPVGRLDKDTSGLLLLTNDGTLAHQLTHPSFAKQKEYNVELDKLLQPLHHQMISDIGLNLPDGHSKLALQRQHEGNDYAWHITMHEGRNRQIRRTFAALDYKVVRLHRTRFGKMALGGLSAGALKVVSKDELL